MKYTATLSPVQVGQAVKALVLLGEKKITIEETERTVSSSPQQPKRPIPKRLSESYHGKERFSMPKLNFYDTDAVKAFLLNTLVENKEAREDVDFERRQSQTWFTQYQAQKGRAEAAEAKIAAAVSTLTATLDARSAGTVTAEDVDQAITDALALLTGSMKAEGGAAK